HHDRAPYVFARRSGCDGGIRPRRARCHGPTRSGPSRLGGTRSARIGLVIKALERLGAIWSQLVGAVSVVYLFGFVAFKARLNSLGIRTELALLNERYLSEGAAFLAESLRTLMFPYALFAALGVTAFAAAATKFHWWQRFTQRARKSARS